MNVPTDISLQVVGSVAAALLVAAVVALIATPVVRSLAFKIGAVDVPRDSRRMHDHPIPRMGGLAIFFGFILSVLLFLPLTTQLRGMLLSNEPMGRKMDFLIQEVNRESNTIGSKCNDITIAQVVVSLKAEVEKIREQVQNIE